MPKTNKPIAVTFAVFGIIFASISLVNHYLLRTAALDLGMFNNALYCFSNFKGNDFLLSYAGTEINYFADHFSPITLLYTPFYYVFGSYTLLIIQIAAILFGALGIYKTTQQYGLNSKLSLLLTIQFLSIWGIYSALAYDFHNNVVAAMLLPWLFVFRKSHQWGQYLICFLLILISKENMALWLIFIQLFFIVEDLTDQPNLKHKLKSDITLLAIATIYTLVVLTVIMPYLRNGIGYDQLSRYHHLGDTPLQIITHVFSHPLETLKLLFINTLETSTYDGIKLELHLMILTSGGYALLRYPKYLIILIPIYGQNLLSNNFATWGINGQYSIEFAPVITLALIEFIAKIKNNPWQKRLAYASMTLTIVATLITFQSRKSKWYKKENHQFYAAKHYRSKLNITEIYNAFELIPDDVAVCASSNLTPHLANRERIYLFPFLKDASYVMVLTKNNNTYPLNQEKFDQKVNYLKSSGYFEIVLEEHGILIAKRK